MLWLAFKKSSRNTYKERLVAWWNRAVYGHVELIMEIRCPGPKTCPLCDIKRRHAPPLSLATAATTKHYVNLAVHQNEPVFFNIDRTFESNMAAWVFVQIPVLQRHSPENMLRFMQRQLDKDYNDLGCWCNLVFGSVCQCYCCRGCAASTGVRKLSPADVDEADDVDQWFCSELVTATLQVGGFDDVFDMDPCATTPQQLFNKATQIAGARITPCPSAKSNTPTSKHPLATTTNTTSNKPRTAAISIHVQ